MSKNADLIYKDECYKILGACMEVHRELGNGFLEPVYHEALTVEFNKQGVPFESEKIFKIIYSGVELKSTYVADFVCFDKIILEIKATSSLSDAHVSQLLNYLNASKMRVGLLVNFGEASPKYQRCVL